ncbi:MAG: hypothetical protein ABH833_01660 [Parcubacteria group bacterium]
MTVYCTNSNGRKKAKGRNSILCTTLKIFNVVLLVVVVVGLLGNILASNVLTSHDYKVVDLKDTFNNLSSNTAHAAQPATDIDELMEFAKDHGMVENKTRDTLVHNTGVALK